MTVNYFGIPMSISPVSASMMSVYVPSTVTSKSDAQNDLEHQAIMKELASLGIAPTGDKTTDKVRLDTAKRMIEMQKTQQTKSKDSIPFDDVMNTLNLTITGDLDKDYDTTIDKLDYEIDMAYTEEEKAYYEALKYQVEDEYNSAKQNSISYFTGMSQIGTMNRYLLGL